MPKTRPQQTPIMSLALHRKAVEPAELVKPAEPKPQPKPKVSSWEQAMIDWWTATIPPDCNVGFVQRGEFIWQVQPVDASKHSKPDHHLITWQGRSDDQAGTLGCWKPGGIMYDGWQIYPDYATFVEISRDRRKTSLPLMVTRRINNPHELAMLCPDCYDKFLELWKTSVARAKPAALPKVAPPVQLAARRAPPSRAEFLKAQRVVHPVAQDEREELA